MLRYLLERERRPELRLPEILEISEVVGLTHDETSDLIDILEVALTEGDSKVAVEVLKAVGLYGQVGPPSGPEDAELVLWEEAKAWAEMEIRKRGPSGNPTLDLLLMEEEMAVLTQQNMKELRNDHGNSRFMGSL